MPNWFYFTIEVYGDLKDIKEFQKNVSSDNDDFKTEFDFNHFIPQPENIFSENLSSDKKKELDNLGIPNWYDWNISNWGTKWNASVEDVEQGLISGGSYFLVYHLRTAWAFPNPVIHKMLEQYPTLEFTISGEEESREYGIYIDSKNEIWEEEEPMLVDGDSGKEVYYNYDECLWKYVDDDTIVDDQDDFWADTKYSWS